MYSMMHEDVDNLCGSLGSVADHGHNIIKETHFRPSISMNAFSSSWLRYVLLTLSTWCSIVPGHVIFLNFLHITIIHHWSKCQSGQFHQLQKRSAGYWVWARLLSFCASRNGRLTLLIFSKWKFCTWVGRRQSLHFLRSWCSRKKVY